MEGIEHSAYPCANAVVANDKPTIARVALAEPGRPNSRTDEVMVTSAIGCPDVWDCTSAVGESRNRIPRRIRWSTD
jgi:hypothetical protein